MIERLHKEFTYRLITYFLGYPMRLGLRGAKSYSFLVDSAFRFSWIQTLVRTFHLEQGQNLPAKLHMIFNAWTIRPIRLRIVTPY